jgi:hypothetical protein
MIFQRLIKHKIALICSFKGAMGDYGLIAVRSFDLDNLIML